MHKTVVRILCFIILTFAALNAQERRLNKYGLFVVSDAKEYLKMVDNDSSNKLVNLKELIPSIKLDIRYATRNNFLGQPVYSLPEAFLRLPAAYALKKAVQELKLMGLGIKVFDAYRPYSATVKFYDKVKDTVYVASAWTGSRHNRGCAVDLTLISLKTGKPLDMPTGFDSFLDKAHSDYLNLNQVQLKNRALLIGVMAKYGFNNYPGEWWHYDYKDWKKFDLMDISFEQLNGK